MYKMVFRDSLFMAIVPFLTMFFVVSFSGDSEIMRMLISVTGVVLQIPVVILCKRNVRKIFQPPAAALKLLGIKRVSCAYEPGKFKTDFKVVGVLLWLSAMAPFIASVAILLRKTHTVPILNFATYEAPNMALIMLSVTFLLIGMMMLPLWVKFGQAMIISNEGNDGNRYLYMGFAEEIEEGRHFKEYEKLIRDAKAKSQK